MFISFLKKELSAKFSSPWVYGLSCVFNLIIGWMFFSRLSITATGVNPGIEQDVILPIMGNINFILFLISPVLCMKSFSEEKKNGTMNLLYLSRLKDWHIYLGKFIAVSLEGLFILSFSLVIPLVLFSSGYDNYGIIFTSYLGLCLSMLCYISVGLFASSISSNQIVATLISYGILFSIFLISTVASMTPNYIVRQIVSYLSLATHIETLFRGMIVSYNVLYVFSFVALFFIFSLKSMESRKW